MRGLTTSSRAAARSFTSLIAGFAAAVVAAAPGVATAAQTSWVPSLTVRGEYDDNVEFVAAAPHADLSAWVSPALAVRRSTERWWLEGGAKLDAVRYLDRTDLNRLDQLYRVSGASSWTERLRVEGSASYRQGSTLESQLDETGRVSRRSPLYQFRGDAGGSYGLTRRSRVGVEYGYFKSAYAAGSSVDFDGHDLSLVWQVDLRNERDRVSVRPSYRTFDSDITAVDDVSLTVGWHHPVSETWTLDLAGGGRFTRYDTRGEADHQWGGILDLSSTWTGERTTAEVGVNADLTYGSDGIPLERDRLRGSLRHDLGERWWAGLSGDLALTRDLGSSGRDRLFAAASPSVGYRLSPAHTLAASYRCAYDRDEARTADRAATRNRVWLEWRGSF